jgi:hypothetical protein
VPLIGTVPQPQEEEMAGVAGWAAAAAARPSLRSRPKSCQWLSATT